MINAPIAVVAPLKAEIAHLVRRLRGKRRHRLDATRWWEGMLRGRRLIVATTGDGRRAGGALDALLDRVEVHQVVIVGVAGALSPTLTLGTIVVGDDVRGEAGPAPKPCVGLVRRAASMPGVLAGTLVSGARIVVTPKEKAALWHAHGAPEPAAVDLETAGLAGIAAGWKKSYVAIRAISDVAAEVLPIDFNRWTDGTGHVRQGAVAWHAIKRPWLIPPLMGLGRRVDRCAEGLANVVEGLVSEAK